MDIHKNYYEILGVTPSANLSAIKAAYRVLSQKFHPDKKNFSPEYATKMMVDLNEAYVVLSNRQKRARYDEKSMFGSMHLGIKTRHHNVQSYPKTHSPKYSDQNSDSQSQFEAPMRYKNYISFSNLITSIIFSSILAPFILGILYFCFIILNLYAVLLPIILIGSDLVTVLWNCFFYLVFDDSAVEDLWKFGELGPSFINLQVSLGTRLLIFTSLYLGIGFYRDWWPWKYVNIDKIEDAVHAPIQRAHENLPKSVQASLIFWRCKLAFGFAGGAFGLTICLILFS